MSKPVIKVEHLSKAYQIGQIGTGTISRDLERFWAMRVKGKEDPFLRIGETNDRSIKGTSDIVWSLRDINFEINQGEAVGIIGKNGAGKSTLLKLLSRVTGPTSGSIKVKGRIASLLEVGTGFHPELSGRENIYLNGAILGMRKKEITQKLDEIIDFSGVERYIDTPVKRYSSGMYVRLAFAVAAHLESEILIVDEVLAVGDAEFRNKCLGKMQDISGNQGRTVLFVSHDMTAISTLCSKGIVLQNGSIVHQGDVSHAIEYYISGTKDEIHSDLDFSRREGDGSLRVIDLEFENGRVLKSGDKLKITFTLDRPITAEEYEKFVLMVTFNNSLKRKILSLSNRYDGQKPLVEASDKVSFEIESLPLGEGLYTMNYWMAHNSPFSDGVSEIAAIEVIGSDYFGTGYMPVPRKHGEFLVNHKVRLEP